MAQRTVTATEFRARCLKLIDCVEREQTPLLVTKRGRPLVKIMPIPKKRKSLYGYMAGTGEIVGDIVSPVDVDWEANR
jgi:prevent-host-death family protein